jgi:lysophospholipase L1-like esterase
MPVNPIPAIPGLKAYYKADAGLWQDTAGTTPAVANADPVGRWDDQSGNGYHLTQATAGNRPTLATNRFKGLPAVNFLTASSQWLTNAAFPWTQSKTSGAWVVAAQIDSGCPASGFVTTTQDQLAVLCIDGGFFGYFNSAAAQTSNQVPVTNQGYVASLVYDGTQSTPAAKLRLFRNLSQQTLTLNNGVNATTYAGGSTLYMGRQAAGGYLTGRVVEAAFFSSLSDSDRVAATNYLGATYFSRTTKDLLCVGDSRTYGAPSSTNNTLPLTGADSYPLHAQFLLGAPPWTMTNFGQNGIQASTFVNFGAFKLQDDWAAGQAAVAFGGTNDFYLAGATPTQVYGYLTAWVAKLHSYGFTHVFLGTQPWDTQTTTQTNISDLNTMIRGNAAGADGVIDFAADARFSSLAATSNTTYYAADGVHFTDTGYAALAGIAAPSVRAALPSGAFRRASLSGGFPTLSGGF